MDIDHANQVEIDAAVVLVNRIIGHSEGDDDKARDFLQFVDLVFEASRKGCTAVEAIKIAVDRTVYAKTIHCNSQITRFIGFNG